MTASIFVALQYVLPKYWMTALMWRLARIRRHSIKNFIISRFVAIYGVDTDDVKLETPGDFETFNAFFTRELDEDARTVDTATDSIISPVDGTVSLASTLNTDSLIQAKGINYTLDELLGVDLSDSSAYIDGSFSTIYLAPHNYHRVHSPFDGELHAARYIPGDLFSVNAATVARINGLFRRNERLIMHFRTTRGPAALIFVGALMVGSITTPWTGEIRPRKRGIVDVLDVSPHPGNVRKGDLLGWFNMGSTVILLMPRDVCSWNDNLVPGHAIRMGESIGKLLV